MRRIDLNDLPRWSPWPAILCSSTPPRMLHRTREQVRDEYDTVKYAISLRLYQESGGTMSPEAVRLKEFGRDPDQELCLSVEDDLYLTTWRDGRGQYANVLLNAVRPAVEQAATVVELGCGYAYNLWFLHQHFPEKRFVGGDYSVTAVELAQRLYAAIPAIRVELFDFYDVDYSLLEALPSPISIFTCHAVEQLPSAAPLLEALSKRRDTIHRVVHLEPGYELHDGRLLDYMRRRYSEVNDYNRDLITQLRSRAEIRILHLKPNLIGLNPLNPTSVIEWEFVS